VLGQSQKLADILHAKAEVAGVADEIQAVYRALIITALPTFAAAWRGNETILLIKANGRDFDPGEFCKPSIPTSGMNIFLLNL
jgi:hypothetical protein